jgi:P-type Mg2+ transporter
MVLPFTPAGGWFGFQTPPLAMLAAIGAISIVYLVSAELLKPWAVRVRQQSAPAAPS